MKIRDLVLYVLLLSLIIYSTDKTLYPDVEYREVRVLMPVNEDSLIQAARRGWIPFDREALIERFGSIYKDTSTHYRDSLCLRDSVVIREYINEIWDVQYLAADTTIEFAGQDSSGEVKWNGSLDLNTVAWWAPVYAIETYWEMNGIEISFPECKPMDRRWYDRFYLGVGLDAGLRPGIQIGYGLNVGDLRRWLR